MLAHVYHRVGAEGVPQPEVGAEVVVAGRHIGVVVNGDRVLAESARRLHEDHDVVGLDCRNDDLAVRIAAAVDEQFTRRLTPVLHHRVAKFFRQSAEPFAVACRRHADRPLRHLGVGEPIGVQSPAFDERVHQRIAVATGQSGHLADAITAVPHCVEQCQRAGWSVQSDGIADAGVLRRIRREHQRDPLIRGTDSAQGGVIDR